MVKLEIPLPLFFEGSLGERDLHLLVFLLMAEICHDVADAGRSNRVVIYFLDTSEGLRCVQFMAPIEVPSGSLSQDLISRVERSAAVLMNRLGAIPKKGATDHLMAAIPSFSAPVFASSCIWISSTVILPARSTLQGVFAAFLTCAQTCPRLFPPMNAPIGVRNAWTCPQKTGPLPR